MDEPDDENGRNRDVDTVQQIKIKCSQNETGIAMHEPVSGCTDRWHQGSRDGDTRNHVRFLFSGGSDNAGKSTEKCDEQVPEGR